MMSFSRHTIILLTAAAASLHAGQWTEPVEVRQEETLCLVYRARLDGQFLVVRASIEPGWHTFSMDNKLRADEKLAGKPSLGIDRPTEITVTGGLEIAGPWRQLPPKDFSKPDLRWFSWGYEGEALFAAPVRNTGKAPAEIGIRGQACTETSCKNIDVSITLPARSQTNSSAAGIDLKKLIPVRQASPR
jgi:hypothetical protein